MRRIKRLKWSLHKTYLRVFATFAILFTIIVTVFSLYLVQIFSMSAREEIDQAAQTQLGQIIENTKFTLYKLRLYGMRMYEDETVQGWFTDYDDPQLLVRLNNNIKKYISSEPFIYNIDLISTSGKRVLTSREAMFDYSEFYDQPLLQEIVEGSEPYLRFSRHDYLSESFIKLAVRAIGLKKPEGYLIMLLDQKLFERYVMQSNDQSLVKIIITDPSSNPIIGEVPENLAQAIPDKSQAETGTFGWENGKQKWTVRYSKIDPEGWTVYQFMPWEMWKSKVSHLRNVILLSAGGMFLLTLFFVFWISRRNYLPFSDLVGLLHKNEGRHDDAIRDKAEYELIRSGIRKLVVQVEQMDQSIKSSQHIIREDLLRQWVQNGNLPELTLVSLRQLTPIAGARRLRLAVVRIESYPSFEEEYTYYSRRLLKYAMGNIVEETMRNRRITAASIDFKDDHLVVLMADPTDDGESRAALAEAKENVSRYLNINCVCAFSTTFKDSFDLNALYRDVLEISYIKFLTGEEKIYDHSDRQSLLGKSSEDIPNDLIKTLIQTVNKGNEAETAKVMDDIFQWLRQLPFEECKFHLARLMYEIAKTFLQTDTLQNWQGINLKLEQYGSLNEVNEWLRKEIQVVQEKVKKPGREKRKEDVAAAVVNFVNQNLHNPILSIEDISLHIGLSPNYVRTIFRDTLQVSLSDFILVQRIEKAKQLLHSTEWPVSQIVEAAGFQAKSHFFTAFKKATGMTPKQFRETTEELN
ncbi:AraC family transcriptional regulator [Paenibacillus sp. 2RAB27]|uniref:AraC family transcriptional regulator n=1 Tax=Paenibacillus sp. 2RAB27 TaxID=3232991 RepID=UPI003F94A9E3